MSTKLNSVDIVGSFFASSHGTDCVVTKYTNSQKVTVRFLDSYEYEGVFPIFALRKSKVPNPYDKTVCGVGCLGEGIYKAYVNRKPTLEYKVWASILRRCYSEKFLVKNPTYRGCAVHPEWHNFQNFADWYVNNESYGLGYELDKDLLVIGNKVYGSSTCCLAPKQLNLLFNKESVKVSKYPLGVVFDKTTGLYKAGVSRYGKFEGLGYFKSAEEASKAYNHQKDLHVKEVTKYWEGKVCKDVLESINNWRKRN